MNSCFRLVAFLKDIPQITIDKIHITSKDFHSYSTRASLSQDATRNRKCIMGKNIFPPGLPDRQDFSSVVIDHYFTWK